jgi:hypothetical protein
LTDEKTPDDDVDRDVEGVVVLAVREWIDALTAGDLRGAQALSEAMDLEQLAVLADLVRGAADWPVARPERPEGVEVEDVVLLDPAAPPNYVTGPRVLRGIKVRVAVLDGEPKIIAYVLPDGDTVPPGR